MKLFLAYLKEGRGRMIYTIIDVETTGGSNRITEISIFKFDGNKVVDEFTSLVNPQSYIPAHITALTGIDNGLVANSPIFSEIAQDILSITEDTIFVAHNVNFDYNVIRNEFKAIGIDFRRSKLCTVRLSRTLIPGHASYSLGKLCNAVGIDLRDRHRARGDAEATVELFAMLLSKPESDSALSNFLKVSIKESTLPSHLPKEVFDAIPNSAGIYYFKNKKGKIIYVGKAKDLKKRVLGHFYNKSKKELDLCRETAHVDFELSGSEIVALLMEDAAIKHHFPEFNSASKRLLKSYSIMSYFDRKGILHLASSVTTKGTQPIKTFHTAAEARAFLESICLKFDLCPKYCHLQDTISECSHYSIKTCKGICGGQEEIELYNERVNAAIIAMDDNSTNLIVKQKGRFVHEEAFIMIRKGKYIGYGFIGNEEQISHEDELENFLIPQKDNLDVRKILKHVLSQ